MKKYMKPIMKSEEFVANEYITACEDTTNSYYKFTCDAGGGVSGNVWLETNGKEGLQTDGWDSDKSLGGYHACQKVHYASADQSELLDEYYRPYGSNKAIDVIVWRGEYNNNTHCTEALKTQIETVKGNFS